MAALTQKSQVTIPKNIREMLGLRPGDEVEFTPRNGVVTLKKKPKKIPFEKWRGYLGTFDSDKVIEALRG